MNTLLKELYNTSEGDMTFACLDSNVNAHYIILNCMHKKIGFECSSNKNCIMINHYSKILNVLLRYLYCEDIQTSSELNAEEIVQLYDLIFMLGADLYVDKLKNHYAKQFSTKININNWTDLIAKIYDNKIYYQLVDSIYDYFKLIILKNNDDIKNILINKSFDNLNDNIKNTLFYISIDQCNSILAQLNDIKNKEITTSEQIIKETIESDLFNNDSEQVESYESVEEIKIKEKSNKKVSKKSK